jgi:hypothetical protein
MGVRRRRLSHRIERDIDIEFGSSFIAGSDECRDGMLDDMVACFRDRLSRIVEDCEGEFIEGTDVEVSIAAYGEYEVIVTVSGTRYETDAELRARDRAQARAEARRAADVDSRRELYERLRDEFESGDD